MAEYIDRQELEEAFDNADPDVCESYPDGYSEWGFGMGNVRDVIRGVPAADVAPVVRCKDCRSADCDASGLWCTVYDFPVLAAHYCSAGERKEERNKDYYAISQAMGFSTR